MPSVSKRREANARLYEPALGRFLSPDPYVQMPDFTQNFNRYSYCLNNPLVYVDENGEWIQYLIGAVVGGVINWVSNGCQFTWEGLSYFGAGVVAGLITVASPGSFKYVSAGLGTTNSILKQGFQSDWKDINFGSALLDGVISGATAAAGAKIAPGMDKIFNKIGINDIKSPLLREVSKGVLSNGPIGGLISGFQAVGDDDPNTTFGSGFWKGLKAGVATGGISGIGNAVLFSTTNKVDLWSGKSLNSNSQNSPPAWNYGDHKSQTKWKNQMNQRGWTEQQINEAMISGKQYSAPNNINPSNGATRYVHPNTGRSVVIDNTTRSILHVGGDGFKY